MTTSCIPVHYDAEFDLWVAECRQHTWKLELRMEENARLAARGHWYFANAKGGVA